MSNEKCSILVVYTCPLCPRFEMHFNETPKTHLIYKHVTITHAVKVLHCFVNFTAKTNSITKLVFFFGCLYTTVLF